MVRTSIKRKMRKLIIFIYFVVSFLNAQLSNLVAGEYLCEYKIYYNFTTLILTSKIWVTANGPDSIFVIDSVANKKFTLDSTYKISYKLHQYGDSIWYYLGQPNEQSFFYAGDSIFVQSTTDCCLKRQRGKRLPVSITSPTYSKLKLYPQPAQNELFVSDLPQGKKVLKLFDLVGKEIWRKESELVKEVIDLSALQNGMYVLEVECEGKRFTEKVLK